jgi:3-keto-5-aminohexanoate cleavage enzyme
MEGTLMANTKLVILVAPNGGNSYDREGAHVPITPEEIAEETVRCREAGASVVHIHARNSQTKEATGDPAVFGDIIKRIRSKCDILIQTTGGIGIKNDQTRPSEEERLGILTIQPPQDLATIPMGTWEFGRPSRPYNAMTFPNTMSFIRKGIAAMQAKKIPFELEIADIGFLNNALRLATEGLFDRFGRNFWLDFVMGFGGMPATARHMVFAYDEAKRCFPNAMLQVVATEGDQFPMCILAASLGLDIVRLGFEDNIYLPNGKPAQHNYQLVEAMARVAKDLGRDVATVDDAREMFGVNKGENSLTPSLR